MSIEIPHEVALFLNFAGVPYPDIDEDQVRELAVHVGNFAAKVRASHEGATGVVQNMGTVWSGYSYEQLISVWARMSATHMVELDRACKVVSKALYIAADVIAAAKAAVLTELAAMASTYLAALAGTFATGGFSAIVAQALPAAARKLLSVMEQVLIAYILAEVLGKAIEPLGQVIERMVGGTLHNLVADVLDLPPPPASSSALPMRIDPDEVLRYANVLDGYADQMLSHAEDFADKVGALDFTTAGGRDLDGSRDDRLREPSTNVSEPQRSDPIERSPAASHSAGPAPMQSPPIAFPNVATSVQQFSTPTVQAGAQPTGAGSNSSVHGADPTNSGGSARAVQSSTAASSNPASGRGDVTASRSGSEIRKAGPVPWGDNGGTRREPADARSPHVTGGGAGRMTSAPRSPVATETRSVPESFDSRSSASASSGSLTPEVNSLPAAAAMVNSGNDLESTVRETGPAAIGSAQGGPPTSSPWRGKPARRRRDGRSHRDQSPEAATAIPDPEIRDPIAAETRGRAVGSTPWTKSERETETAAKVFAPETGSRAPRVTLPPPVSKPSIGAEHATADRAEAKDSASERREGR
ncbi:hypothetical protein [Nocardia sp. NPDC056100]|uniref:WXG100-like domain-containing protein n=1 Tax=Nocardia sp. NPDC056100 TaxID=3345712 RepID=UPI0035D778F7